MTRLVVFIKSRHFHILLFTLKYSEYNFVRIAIQYQHQDQYLTPFHFHERPISLLSLGWEENI